jgi:transposase-like protein
MLHILKRKIIECPHCGHQLHAELDPTQGGEQCYKECPSCNRDIHLNLYFDQHKQVVYLVTDSDDG